MRSKHVGLFVLSLALPSAFSVTAFADPIAFALEEGGAVRFRCRGEGIQHPAEGRFSTVTSHLELDPSDLSSLRGEVQVFMTSITTDSSGWDVMFRRAPFLDIDQFPRATFTVTGVEGATSLESGRWTRLRILGDFTIHGVTKGKSVEALVFWDAETRRLRLRARTEMTWDEHDISMPEGNTRSFAGDRAALLISLDFIAPVPPAEPRRRRR
jgi:polyisoprenoid-binding protein YceI